MAGTALTAGMCAATLALTAALVLPAGAGAASARVAGAADAAALAAADALTGAASGDPCLRAGRAAAANAVVLDSCTIQGGVATVRVSGSYGPFPIHAQARAGAPATTP